MRDSSSSLNLEWEKVSKWYAQTTNQQFRCRRFVTGDDVISEGGEMRYQLYDRRGQKFGPAFATFDEAASYAEMRA